MSIVKNYTIGDVQAMPKEIEAVIVNLSIVKAKKIFGENAYDNEREYLELEFENNQYQIKAKDHFPYANWEKVPDFTKLGQFLLTYNELNVGKKIKIKRDPKNFWKIVF